MGEIRTVTLRDLCPDRCNFKDKEFEAWVDEFMNRYMPGFPLGLLDTGEGSYERWQIQADDRYEVAELHLTVYVCCSCGEEYPFHTGDRTEIQRALSQPPVCCPLEAIGKQGGEDGEELFEKEERTWIGLRDTDESGEPWVETAGDTYIDLPPGDDDSIWVWEEDDRDAATQAAQDKNEEASREDRHGFPWANCWAFYPADNLSDEMLKAAGFVVATYCGETGNWRTDGEYRLCGIDGGGYSFKGQHFAPLAAAAAAAWSLRVPTEEGLAYITEEEK